MEVRELEIPVPWGHIAAITFGDEINPLVLVVHGNKDNAGAFEQLIPRLPKSFYYFLIDLPGHGKSSLFPTYHLVHFIDYVVAFKYLFDSLRRKVDTLICHSFASHIGLIFTQLYPEIVGKLIALDCVTTYPISIEHCMQQLKLNIQKLNRINKKISEGLQRPSYGYDECLQKLHTERMYSGVSMESAKALSKRCLVPVDSNKFSFSTDSRAYCYSRLILGEHSLVNIIKSCPVTCPILYIFSNDSIPVLEYLSAFIKEIQKINNHCFIVKVDGNHDVHMNDPNNIAPIITNFLIHRFSKL